VRVRKREELSRVRGRGKRTMTPRAREKKVNRAHARACESATSPVGLTVQTRLRAREL